MEPSVNFGSMRERPKYSYIWHEHTTNKLLDKQKKK